MRIGNRYISIVVKNGFYTSVFGGKEVGRWRTYPSPYVVAAAWGFCK